MTIAGRRLALVAAVVVAGCSSSTELPRRLPVTVSVSYGNVPGDSSVTVKGDSVIAQATLPASCGGELRGDAGMVGDALRIVVTDSLAAPIPCALISNYRTIRAAVAGAPAGTYPAELDLRSIVGSSASRDVVTRQAVSLP